MKITASIFVLTTFTLLAQPALPTTNPFIVPIANPYSASWIYYTTNADSGLGFLNGASIPFVMAVSNNIVTSISTATNGLVGASITNGLATTNFVLSQGYVTSAVTNGLASTSYVNTATNGLASTSYVNAATNGLVTSAVTNGLASTNFVMAATNNFGNAVAVNLTNAANQFSGTFIGNGNGLTNLTGIPSTNGLVTAAVTNGLASISYVNAATNGLVGPSITNGLATTNFVLSQGYVTSAVTNGLASISYVNTATNGFVTSSVTNGLATTNYVNTTALSAGPGGNTDAQLITNLQNVTWGTATAKPAGAGAPATVYYYFTNGYPMFGIISTNN